MKQLIALVAVFACIVSGLRVNAVPIASVEHSPRYSLELPTLGTDDSVDYEYVFDFGALGALASGPTATLKGIEKATTTRTKNGNSTQTCKGYSLYKFVGMSICANPGTITTTVCELPLYSACTPQSLCGNVDPEGSNWLLPDPYGQTTTLQPHVNVTIEVGRTSASAAYTYSCGGATASSSGLWIKVTASYNASNQSAVTSAFNSAIDSIKRLTARAIAGPGSLYSPGDVWVQNPRWSFSVNNLFAVDLLNNGTSSATATIYASTDGSTWSSVSTNTLAASSLIGTSPAYQTRIPSRTTWYDSGSSGASKRFYRVKISGSCIGQAFGYAKFTADSTYASYNNPFVNPLDLNSICSPSYSGGVNAQTYRSGSWIYAELDTGAPPWTGDFTVVDPGEAFQVAASPTTTIYLAGFIANGSAEGIQPLKSTYDHVGSFALNNYTLSTSGLPATSGDKVHKWNKSTQSFQTSTYTSSWSTDFSISFGEGFLFETSSDDYWASGTSLTCP